MSARTETAELLKRLRRHYIKPSGMPGGLFIHECGVNGSWGAASRCDALYAGFTSASGRILVGHELKVTRSDWLHELDQIDKADTWADQCHAWYLVVSDPSIVHEGELPHGWGLMAPTARTRTRLATLIPATVHADRQPSWDAVRSIMARVETLSREAASEARTEAWDEVDRRVAERLELERARDGEPMTFEDRQRLDQIDRFEDALGMPIRTGWDAALRYDPATLGQAITVLNRIRRDPSGMNGPHLDRMADQLATAAEALRDAAVTHRGLVAQLESTATTPQHEGDPR